MVTGIRTSRTEPERATDALLTLCLYNLVQDAREESVGDRLKAMKHLFLVTHSLFKRRVRAFNFSFYRYTHGPFTQEAYVTWEELQWAGLLKTEPGASGEITVTQAGQELAREFHSDVLSKPENRTISEIVNDTVDATASLTTGDMLKRVYGLRVVPIGWDAPIEVGRIPIGVYLTRIVEMYEANSSIRIGSEWIRRYRLSTYTSQASASKPLADATAALTLEDMDELDEVLEEEERGEAKSIDMEDIRATYGL